MALTSRPITAGSATEFEIPSSTATSRENVRARIVEAGLIPAIRTTSEEDLLFAAGALVESGIAILEISSTFPGFLNLIERACQEFPDLIVGAGNLFDARLAQRSLDAGAKFLTSDGLVLDVVEVATEREVVVLPGALTPKEVIDAWKTGAEFVKVTPCDAMGGENYMRTLKVAFPQVRFVASGGVTQQNVSGYIQAGATAVAVGKDLISPEAIRLRQKQRIQEMVRRFVTSIDSARG
jgi:2-dehydro-3-deoxyphosphogluconate aldolase/(4S)-4-hydroxy-2-oxoglutarate aldolase